MNRDNMHEIMHDTLKIMHILNQITGSNKNKQKFYFTH